MMHGPFGKQEEDYFDEDGRYIVPGESEEEWSPEVLLNKPAQVERTAEDDKPTIMGMSQREQS